MSPTEYRHGRNALADAVRRGDRNTAKRLTKRLAAAQMKLFADAPKQPTQAAPFNDDIDFIGR